MPKKIENDTKIKALERWIQGDDIDQVAKELQISVQSIKDWQKQAKEENFIANVHIGPKPSEKAQEEVKIGQFEGIVHQAQKHPNEQSAPVADMYKTGSLQVAVALEMAGFEMVNVTGDDRKVCHFISSNALMRTVEEYWDGTLQGSLCDFASKLHSMRERLMNKRS